MQTPIDQSLNLFTNANPLLGLSLRVLYEKAKRAKHCQVRRSKRNPATRDRQTDQNLRIVEL